MLPVSYLFLDIVLFISRQVGKVRNGADVAQPNRGERRETINTGPDGTGGISGGFLFTSAA